MLTTPIEHKAILGAVHQAAPEGADERICSMTPNADLDVESFRELFGTDTAVASVMWLNNEIGCIQPIAQLAETPRPSAMQDLHAQVWRVSAPAIPPVRQVPLS